MKISDIIKSEYKKKKLLDWLEDLILWECPDKILGKEIDELSIDLLVDAGWGLELREGMLEDIDESFAIRGKENLQLEFKVIRNEVYVCFKGTINITMFFWRDSARRGRVKEWSRGNYDVDFKVKVFNNIPGGEILGDLYLDLYTREV